MAKKAAKAVKKHWYSVQAPALFDKAVFGEVYLVDPSVAVGRFVQSSLMRFTGEPQKQNVTVKLVITGVKKDVLETEFVSYKVLPSAVRRLVRRRRDKLDDSFVVKTKDDKFVRIKPLVTTRGRASNSVLTAMRALIRAKVAELCSKTALSPFVRMVVEKRLQGDLSKALHKLHPVGACEVRQLVVLSGDHIQKKHVRVLLPEKVNEPAVAEQ